MGEGGDEGEGGEGCLCRAFLASSFSNSELAFSNFSTISSVAACASLAAANRSSIRLAASSPVLIAGTSGFEAASSSFFARASLASAALSRAWEI